MSIRVEHADMLEAIPRLVAEGVVCDAIVTDPPYHLTSGNHVLDAAAYKRLPGDRGQKGAARGGFMGQQWDGGDIAFRPETWATVATILRPGAFLVAFGGTRTYHRLACAIEDGGFVIQDCLMWLFATGFPKRRNALKPAYEPVILAYKPGGRRTMQVDECRIGTCESLTGGMGRKANPIYGTFNRDTVDRIVTILGRWPANIVHDGSDEVLAAFPDSAAGQPSEVRGRGGIWSPSADGIPCGPQYGDSGSAARFFFSAKAGTQDRWGSRHPTVKPVELMKWLVALVTPPGGTCIDPFAGSGTTGVAALATGRNAILIEREVAYIADIRERMAHYEGGGRHSLASKARQARPRGDVPLLDHRPYDEAADAIGSYYDAVRAIGERVKAGAPVPDFFLPARRQMELPL